MTTRVGWRTIRSGLADIDLLNGVEKKIEGTIPKAKEIMEKFGDSI
jgi:hypothetical protein